ncbi:dolichol kinase-like [Homarus americanus]|uniref:dolichol kinase n=1 Tax=Homarus americanus TaxID=6706 RepID=A0A8J5K7U6_HOMAM|nr:dolichol kinase-like [Homarus americanus]XP_042217844.1 dolichol kinase-like [Homarus americanus]KAG7171345.1 Dolichol kinase-like [Homarus americanus]
MKITCTMPFSNAMMNIASKLPSVSPLHLDHLNTRYGASPGVWLMLLVPLACSSGLYTAYIHCYPPSRLLALLAIQVGVSGIHLYKQMCVSGSHHKTESQDNTQTSSLFLRFLFHPYTPALVTAVAISFLTEIHPIGAIMATTLCAWILYELTHWLFRSFPGSFSLGEGAVVGQTGALAITCSLCNIFTSILMPRMLSDSQKISLFVQTAVLIFSSMVVGLYKLPLLHTARMFVPFVCVCGTAGVAVSSLLLGKWTPLWLLDLIIEAPTRLTLLAWWSGLALVAVALTTWARRRSNIATTVLRKVYHVVIILVFTPGILLEPAFTHLAATAAVMFCLLLEMVRVKEIEPIASIISQAFSTFLDEKDGGTLVLSHIYLLAGVASPLWISPCQFLEVEVMSKLPPESVLPLLAGVLAVGVGDTAASVGGTYLGRRRWSGTKKTVEGSLCGVIAQMMAVLVLVGIGVVDVSLAAWGRLVISASLVAVVEALTDQVDNIVLPLLLYTPLMDL